MINKVVIVCKENTKIDFKSYENAFFIGVERGCLELIRQGINIDLAISDFDNVSDDELAQIKLAARSFKKLSTNKDLIDGEEAILEALKYSSNITLVTEGERFDMNLASIALVLKYNVKLFNKGGFVNLFKQGSIYSIKKTNFKYVSFFSVEKSLVDITDFKYEAKDLVIENIGTNAISNELLENQVGKINVKKGNIIAIFTN